VPAHERQHEPDLQSSRSLVSVMAAVLGLVVVLSAVAWFGFRYASPQASPPILPSPGMPAPVPELQVSPEQDLNQLMASQRQRLHGVGWVDREAGIVHMPIKRAMALLVKRGLKEGSP
jgi:hypothetical protein